MSEYKMNPRQIEHFKKTELARKHGLEFARSNGIPLVEIGCVGTFSDWDNGIEVWFFYQTDEQVKVCELDGTSRRLADFLKQTLVDLDYSFEAFPELIFHFDSKQNVDANYKGNYRYRLS